MTNRKLTPFDQERIRQAQMKRSRKGEKLRADTAASAAGYYRAGV